MLRSRFLQKEAVSPDSEVHAVVISDLSVWSFSAPCAAERLRTEWSDSDVGAVQTEGLLEAIMEIQSSLEGREVTGGLGTGSG
jgi:hypothetical protein